MEAADEPSEDGTGWLGIHRFDVQLAIVFGVLSAIGWAVITGANSTPVGRIGFAAIGTPIGVLFGLRTGWFYRDSGPTGRAFLHWMAYYTAVLVVSAAVSSGRPSVDTLLAASVAVPVGVLVGRNLLEKLGDRRLGAGLSPLVIAVVGLLIVVEQEGGGAQIVAGVGLGVALVVVVCLDVVSRRSRVATGDVPPMPPRTRPRGWRLWLRLIGVVLCLTGAAARSVRSRSTIVPAGRCQKPSASPRSRTAPAKLGSRPLAAGSSGSELSLCCSAPCAGGLARPRRRRLRATNRCRRIHLRLCRSSAPTTTRPRMSIGGQVFSCWRPSF